ncbi:MAG: biotin/lipoyl-containing protein [Candidatus Undinarchaeales archaeon]|jgi:biotin carboxyl carrier protein|nr:biotin/lipoyl-containing protein [Candidatus Undinarchaeales archaeon]MDP7492009.1 biotin/lipoyl-containing protein [Candidatus Undinarchaeales archaeon]
MEDKLAMRYTDVGYEYGSKIFVASVEKGDDSFTVSIDGEPHEVRIEDLGGGAFRIHDGARSYKCIVASAGDKRFVSFDGEVFTLTRVEKSSHVIDQSPSSKGDLTAQMPGRVVKVLVGEGDGVQPHQDLLILEAMKMECKVTAPFHGTVKKVHFKEGDLVNVGDLLFDIESKEGSDSK